MDKDIYTMLEACEETGLSYQTLKYYCNEGLVPRVERDERNRRVFDARAIAWIKDLSCLKRCGMGIAEMRAYLDLCLQGEQSIPERQSILEAKRVAVAQQIAELQASLEYIDQKQRFYEAVLAGEIPFRSNLVGE